MWQEKIDEEPVDGGSIAWVLVALLAIVVIAAIFMFAGGARAAELCQPIQPQKHGRIETAMTHEQWLFLSGIYAMSPLTPPGLPFGDRAVLVTEPGIEDGVVVFIDGANACTPMPVPKKLLDMLTDVAAGIINHEGNPL